MASAYKVMKLGPGFPGKEAVDKEIGNNTDHTIFRLGPPRRWRREWKTEVDQL